MRFTVYAALLVKFVSLFIYLFIKLNEKAARTTRLGLSLEWTVRANMIINNKFQYRLYNV